MPNPNNPAVSLAHFAPWRASRWARPVHTFLSILMIVGFGWMILLTVYSLPLAQHYEPADSALPLSGLYPVEQNAQFTYAYSHGTIAGMLPAIGQGDFLLSLDLGTPGNTAPMTVQLRNNDGTFDLGTIKGMRTYHILLPADTQGQLAFEVQSNTVTSPPDPRTLGVFIRHGSLRSFSASTPPPALMYTATLAALVFALVLQCAEPRHWHRWLWRGGAFLIAGITTYNLRRTATADLGAFNQPLLGALAALAGAYTLTRNTWKTLWARNRRLVAGVATGSVLFLFLWHVSKHYTFMIDDTFISLVYVKNVLQGNGLTFNKTYVAGYSNFLWVVVIALFGITGLPLLLIAKWLGIGCSLAIIALLPRLSRHYLSHWFTGLLAAALLAASSSFVVWSVAGLETTGFALLILLSIYVICAEEQQQRIRWSMVVLPALALMRPEGIGLVIVLQGVRVGWQWFAQRGRRTTPSTVVKLLVPFFIYGMFIAWHRSYYGYPFPTTVYAKTGDTAGQINGGLKYISTWLQEDPLVYALGLLGAPIVLVARPPRLPNLLLTGCISAYSLFIIISGGDWMPAHRFMIPLFPLIYLALAQMIVLLNLVLQHRNTMLGLAVLLFLIAGSLSSVWQASQRQYTHLHDIADSVELTNQIGRQMATLVKPGDTIALIDAGAIPFYTDAPIIDMVGLNDNHIAHLPGGFLNKYDNEYVLAHQPTFIHMHVVPYANTWKPTDFIGSAKLYYSAEFHTNYAQIPELPLVFRRRSQPLEASVVRRFYDVGYRAQPPSRLERGKPYTLPITLTNNGYLLWQAHNTDAPWGKVQVIVEWRNSDGQLVATNRVPLPHDVIPGESVSLDLPTVAPDTAGMYQLQVDIERRLIYRFSAKGAPPWQATVQVH